MKEKKFREINAKRLEYYARKEDEHDYTKLHYIKKYATKNDKYMKNKKFHVNNIGAFVFYIILIGIFGAAIIPIMSMERKIKNTPKENKF